MFVRIFLSCLFIINASTVSGLGSFSAMMTIDEKQQKKFIRMVAGLDNGAFDIISPSNKVRSKEYRIHMIGDSTMRNQWSALCSLFAGSPKKLPQPTNMVPSLQCIGDGWGYKRLIATGTFDFMNPLVASQMPGILAAATKAYNISHFDAITFGSTALHALQLFPYRDLGDTFWQKAIHFENDVSNVLRVVKNYTSCPIFQTIHYICDNLFVGKWADAIKDIYSGNDSKLRSICQKRLPQSVEVCMEFSFTSKGSTRVAQLEQHGIKSVDSAIGIVDTYALTYTQCWATSDGVHYVKLIPLFLKALSEHVRACQVSPVSASVELF